MRALESDTVSATGPLLIDCAPDVPSCAEVELVLEAELPALDPLWPELVPLLAAGVCDESDVSNPLLPA